LGDPPAAAQLLAARPLTGRPLTSRPLSARALIARARAAPPYIIVTRSRDMSESLTLLGDAFRRGGGGEEEPQTPPPSRAFNTPVTAVAYRKQLRGERCAVGSLG